MGKVIASITTSVDGYVTGPDDGPEYGLGRGGERLHYWVMGGPWTYEGGHDFAMHGPDKEFYDELVSTVASGVVGRGMYNAAGAWGVTNPFPGALYVLTHRTADQPAAKSGFRLVANLDLALAPATEAAGDGDVAVGGGGDVIRQALAAGKVDELVISTAPVILCAGKRLFDGVRPGRGPQRGQGLQLAVRHPRALHDHEVAAIRARAGPASLPLLMAMARELRDVHAFETRDNGRFHAFRHAAIAKASSSRSRKRPTIPFDPVIPNAVRSKCSARP